MEKENNIYADFFFNSLFGVDPIDRILVQILKCNPNVTAHFNHELKIWDFYGKGGEKIVAPIICDYLNHQLFLKNGDGTSTLVGIFHIS